MKSTIRRLRPAAALLGAWLAAWSGWAAETNAVPWTESFEGYAEGFEVAGTNGWRADTPAAGVATTNAGAVAALGAYEAGGGEYPLPGAGHAMVLKTTAEVRNEVQGAPGGVVVVDFLALPEPLAAAPPGDTDRQSMFYVGTNGHVVVWHRNLAVDGTNEWLDVEPATPVAAGAWTRFTVVNDYGHGLYQVSVNGRALTNAAGWTAGGVEQPGSWFHMVQGNGRLSRVRVGDEGTNYVDDVVVTNRSLGWSGVEFVESGVNNGTMEPTTAVVVRVRHDAWTGLDGEDFVAAGKVAVTGLPGNLVAVARRDSAEQVTVTLGGTAQQHESGDSLTNLAIRFLDGAFTLGQAADVTGREQDGLGARFLDTPRLSYGGTAFVEGPENLGTIDNSTPVLIDLAHGAFNGGVGENFATNAGKAQFVNLPAGLTGELVLQGATQVRLRLLGTATHHAAADSVGNIGLSFGNGAFEGVPASSVFNASTNLGVTFADPSVLSYATGVFAETAANDGSVGGTTVSLSNKTFNAADGEDLVAAGKATVQHVPAGLTVTVVRASATSATLGFAGRAAAHTAADSVADLGLSFTDGAFVGAGALGVTGATRTDLAVVFSNAPVVTAAGTNFVESGANNGTVSNVLAVTLEGEVFRTGEFTEGVDFVSANVPVGLTLQVSGNGASAAVSLTGAAALHGTADTTGGLMLTFLDGAFVNVAAANVAGHPLRLAVAFEGPPGLVYSRTTFAEIAGGYIDNRDPVVIRVSGDTFNGGDGEDLVGAGRIAVANLPAGLTAQALRVAPTELSVRLMGAALAHASGDSVADVTLTFLQGSLTEAAIGEVLGAVSPALSVVFNDLSGFFNVMPYAEPFESYANGYLLAGTNGWTADQRDAGTVTNDAAVTAAELAYLRGHASLPVATDHTQVLRVNDGISTEIHSEGARWVYLDFMTVPLPVDYAPDNDANRLYAFYVNTNRQLVVWHQNRTAEPYTNEWLTLAGAPLIATSEWVRFTVVQDYTNRQFQVRVNEGAPLSDPAGWTEPGHSPTGSWFHMVQTNTSLTRFRLAGFGPTYIDDVTVRTELPATFGQGVGSVFKFR